MKPRFLGLDPNIKVKSTGNNFKPVKYDSGVLDMTEALNGFGIDKDSIIELIRNQCYTSALSEIHRHTYKHLISEPEALGSMLDLHNMLSKKKKPVGIMVSGSIGAIIMDQPFFQTELIKEHDIFCIPTVIGQYHDVNVFVDPYMKWDDKRIIILFKNFYNYNIIEEINTESKINVLNKVYMNIHKPKFKIYTYDQDIY